jgi:hypothetical protein
MTPKRHPNTPENAIYDEANNNWDVGERNADGKEIGLWRCFHADGTLEGETEWGDGLTSSSYRVFHADGSVTQSGSKNLKTGQWHGVMRYAHNDPFFMKGQPEHCGAIEFEWDDGYVIAQRWFDKAGVEMSMTGEPMPARPKTVSRLAHLSHDAKHWIAEERTMDMRFRGDYRQWDLDGELVLRISYVDHKRHTEEKYEWGLLTRRLEYVSESEQLHTNFRTHRGKTVATSSSLFRTTDRHRALHGPDAWHNAPDITETHFDDNGAVTYATRLEKVGEFHERRYEDGALVLEAIWDADPNKPVEKVEYYDDGKVIIDCQRNNGIAVFRLLSTGDIVTEKADQRGEWEMFLPTSYDRIGEGKKTHTEMVLAKFREASARESFHRRAQTHVPSPAVAAVLKRFKWDDSADEDAPLAGTLALLFDDTDEVVRDRAQMTLWWAIEEQDCIFGATYDAAESLLLLLPVLSADADQQRICRNLANMVAIYGFKLHDAKRAKKVIAGLRAHVPTLVAFASSRDNADGHGVMYLLAKLNELTVLRARVRDPSASPPTRVFAACAWFSTLSSKAKPAALLELRALLATETDAAVRAALATLVMSLVSKSTKQDEAIDVLLPYILQPDRQPELFYAWRPSEMFLGEDVGDLLLRCVPKAIRVTLMKPIIDGLRSKGALAVVNDLDVLFGTLFERGEDTTLTPLHCEALLAAADVVDAHPGFVNHSEMFRRHGLPDDSFSLRERAASVKPAPKKAKKAQ